LLVALSQSSYRESFLLGWLLGLAHFTSLLYWIFYVVNHYGKMPIALGILTLLLLTSYLALYPGFCCVIYQLFCNRWHFPPGLALAVGWVSTEYARGHLFTGFPWGLIGYSQVPWLPVVQSMDIFGVLGISFLVVFCNGIFYSLMKDHAIKRKLAGLLVFLVIFAANFIYGKYRLSEINKKLLSSTPLKVAVVQGNIPQDVKWDEKYQVSTINKYKKLTKLAISEEKPKLVIWPETAVPFYFGMNTRLSLRVMDIAKNMGIYLLFGAPGLEYRNSSPRYYNWALIASPRGRITGVYAKEHLVPFGEYVPLKKFLFFVNKIAEGVGDFVPGRQNQELFDVEGKKVGVLICYEVIFPELALQRLERGSNFLVNISNDAWFGDTSAPYQHLEMARARAIETRLPVVRCTNTGISAFIDQKGDTIGTIPLNTAGYLVKDVLISDIKTTYPRVGDILPLLCVLFSALVIFCVFCDKIKYKSILGEKA